MQTFLPYDSFIRSAKALDYRRLGKQRVEAQQILSTLMGRSCGWTRHPAVLMWRGFEAALQMYHDTMIVEWLGRGYRNTMRLFRKQWLETPPLPPWIGDESFHRSHRSNLLRKNPAFYGQIFTDVGPDLPYVWPVSAEKEFAEPAKE